MTRPLQSHYGKSLYTLNASVACITEAQGKQVRILVIYKSGPVIQGIYASYPPLLTPEVFAVWFKHD
jgi:hypothetical protein